LPREYRVFFGTDARNTFSEKDALVALQKDIKEIKAKQDEHIKVSVATNEGVAAANEKLDALAAFYQKFDKIRKDETGDEEHTIRLLETEISHVTRLHDMQAYENHLEQAWFGGTVNIDAASLKSLAEALFFKKIQEAHHLESYAVIVVCLAKAVENELNLRIAEPLRSVDLSAIEDCKEIKKQRLKGGQNFSFGTMDFYFNEIRPALRTQNHPLEALFSKTFSNLQILSEHKCHICLDYDYKYKDAENMSIAKLRNFAAHGGNAPITREQCEIYLEMVKAFLVVWNAALI
jgi:hypothetical protein